MDGSYHPYIQRAHGAGFKAWALWLSAGRLWKSESMYDAFFGFFSPSTMPMGHLALGSRAQGSNASKHCMGSYLGLLL